METAFTIGERSGTRLQGSGVVKHRKLLLELGLTVNLSEASRHLSFECPSAKRTRSHDIPASLLRRGRNIRILAKTGGSQNNAATDTGLLELLAKAFAARQQLVARDPSPLVDAFSKRHQVLLARLSYLASIVEAILSGKQPAEMTARNLLRIGTLPSCWREQKVLLGFG